MRALQGHSGENTIDPMLQCYVDIPDGWIEYIYHMGSAFNCKSIIEAGPIAGGKGGNQGRQACFFKAVDQKEEAKIHHRTKVNYDWFRIEPSGRCTKTQKIGLI